MFLTIENLPIQEANRISVFVNSGTVFPSIILHEILIETKRIGNIFICSDTNIFNRCEMQHYVRAPGV